MLYNIPHSSSTTGQALNGKYHREKRQEGAERPRRLGPARRTARSGGSGRRRCKRGGRFAPGAGRHLGLRGTCGDSRLQALGGRRQRVHGPGGGSVFPGRQGHEPDRSPHLVRGLLQGALPHPARLLWAGLATTRELPVLLRRGLGDPQRPLAGTHLEPGLSRRPPGPAWWPTPGQPRGGADPRATSSVISRECPGALRGCALRC